MRFGAFLSPTMVCFQKSMVKRNMEMNIYAFAGQMMFTSNVNILQDWEYKPCNYVTFFENHRVSLVNSQNEWKSRTHQQELLEYLLVLRETEKNLVSMQHLVSEDLGGVNSI